MRSKRRQLCLRNNKIKLEGAKSPAHILINWCSVHYSKVSARQFITDTVVILSPE
jgi:hypothetical protein